MIGGAWRGRYLEILTRACFAAGSRADARRAADATQACAEEVDLPLASAAAELARAAVELEDGDAASAAGALSLPSRRSTASATSSMRHALGCSPDVHSLWWATRTGQRPSSSGP